MIASPTAVLRHEYAERFSTDPQHTEHEYIRWLEAQVLRSREQITAMERSITRLEHREEDE